MFDRNIFSERLYNLRTSKKVTREALAEALNLSYHAISKMEKGQRGPSTEVLHAIADYFDVSTDYLLGITDNPVRFSVKGIITKNHVFLEGSPEYEAAGIVEKMYSAKSSVTFFNDLSAEDQKLVLDFLMLIKDDPKG